MFASVSFGPELAGTAAVRAIEGGRGVTPSAPSLPQAARVVAHSAIASNVHLHSSLRWMSL